MSRIILIVVKTLAHWVLPNLLGEFADYLEHALNRVTAADAHWNEDHRRHVVLNTLAEDYPSVPEPVHRAAIEIALILVRLGISTTQIAALEKLVTDEQLYDLAPVERRKLVLQRFSALFPDVPERTARLLLEVVVAKLRKIGG